MISDEAAEKAVDYLRDSAGQAAEARNHVVVTEAWIKVVLSEVMAKQSESSIAAAEAAARRSPEYKEAIMAHGEAVKRWETYRMLREAATARLEAWRTQSSNERAARA